MRINTVAILLNKKQIESIRPLLIHIHVITALHYCVIRLAFLDPVNNETGKKARIENAQ